MVLSIVQRCILSYMTTLINLYERANNLDKLDENNFTSAENQNELFHDIAVNEKKLKNVWGCDEFHLIGLLWMLKNTDSRYDPRVNDNEKLFLRIAINRNRLAALGKERYRIGLKHFKAERKVRTFEFTWKTVQRNIRKIR